MMQQDRARLLLTILLISVAPAAALADDITGSENILCTSVQATVCFLEGECEVGAPWYWNIPQFIEIDLSEGVLRTTRASGENRQTSFKNLERESGLIFIQGVERGRAFSFTIEEATGFASAAIARNGITVSVFGACTPLPATK